MSNLQVGVSSFGVLAGGGPGGGTVGGAVQNIVLERDGLCVSILNYGSILQGVWLEGVDHSLTLGSDRLDDYLGPMVYHGGVIGPVANRLTGAVAQIGGVEHRFAPNQAEGHLLHSGPLGLHARLWRVAEVAEDSAVLAIDLPDGLGGFPGNRRVTARWQVANSTLRLELQAHTDATTLINLANHSYWNLDGTPTWAGHSLRIAADRYLPTTADVTPTGEILPVQNTPYDFRTTRMALPGIPPLDTNFCLSDAREELRDVLWLTGAKGVRMTIATTEPGIQVYDGRAAIRPGHAPYEGLAIEPQGWPDAPNRERFPSITLEPGQVYRQVTEWKFAF